MPRIARTDIADTVYHVLNRANARAQIFDSKKDYDLFENILEEAVERFSMRLLAYCLMPNHWHLVLYPRADNDLSRCMTWLTNTHTRRWHVMKQTVGQGHLYQGRYKSFLCETDSHFVTLVRYVERNAQKANLVQRAENWRWSSVWRRENGTERQKKLLSQWPVSEPHQYLALLNEPQTQAEEDALERSITKNIPFGTEQWQGVIIKKYGLEQTLRSVGRPRKNGG
ncbi:MAG: putative transposase [Parcubacteria group bacterium Gr01-1014_48]|nr:MAG: putative transposase [Parcubacteria group bacterium Greene0416_14]TSC73721.1 MAG: putative transposase [Parcubacteria group bacterium Gr01-1014_48]TSD00997.1 MAG: putative transposase [Parcubacteria group bacterium Greene1014_15]TSD08108.1 MAG: putative transposase [Parcubacteria group bacterium Greene0714_4]